ncbi:hypothetical protein RvY_16975 [Ramazzottius varieornatus]|uniref:Uncharacterized protein n=1 Tax=Ramazzottius varieornatus TaxID=947166 RepID=A0A1D1W7P0_RAMVA|nr:hypothetical protein RvY_16975 [Ramazzottius varieornatus]
MDSNGFFRPTKDKAKAPIKFALGKPKLTFCIAAGALKKDAAHSAASVFGRLSPTEAEKTEVTIKTEEDPVDSVQKINQLKPVLEVTPSASIPSLSPPPEPEPSVDELEKQLELFRSSIKQKPVQGAEVKVEERPEEKLEEVKKVGTEKEVDKPSPESPVHQKPKSASPSFKLRFARRLSPSPVERKRPRSRSRSRSPVASKQRYERSRRSRSRSRTPRRRSSTRTPRRRSTSYSPRPRHDRKKPEPARKVYSEKLISSSRRSYFRSRSKSRSRTPTRTKQRSRSRSPMRSRQRSSSRSESRSPVKSKRRDDRSRTRSPILAKRRSRTKSPTRVRQRSRSASRPPTRTKDRSRTRSRSPSPTQRPRSKFSTPRKRDRSEPRSPSRNSKPETPSKKKIPFKARWDNKSSKEEQTNPDEKAQTPTASPIKTVLSPRKSITTVDADNPSSQDSITDSLPDPSVLLNEIEKYLTPDKETGFPIVSETVMGAFPVPFTLDGVGAVLCWPYYTPERMIIMVPYLGLQKPPDETSVENMIVVPAMVDPPPLLMSGCPVGYTPLNLVSIPTYDPTRAIPPPPPTATAPLNQPTKAAVQKLVRIQQKERERRKRLAAEKAAAAQAASALQSDTPTTGSDLSSKTTTPQTSSTRLPELILS